MQRLWTFAVWGTRRRNGLTCNLFRDTHASPANPPFDFARDSNPQSAIRNPQLVNPQLVNPQSAIRPWGIFDNPQFRRGQGP
jgi:hypothetical protein